MRSRFCLAAIAMAAGVLVAAPAARGEIKASEADWPQWRGPNGDGSREIGSDSEPGANQAADDYPVHWGTSSNLLWKTDLPGKGCSTPAVWNRRIYVTAPVEGRNALLIYDWNGREISRTPLDPERHGANRNGSGSNPSPAIDGRAVFVYFKSGALAALDLDGKLLWKANLQERYGKDTLYWDIGTSPVLTEKDVVVAVMQNGGSYLVAFDKASGAVHWKVDRNYETPVECDHSYATPIVARRDGREELLVWGAEHFTTHDAADGRLIASCGDFNPTAKKNWVVVASAVLAGDTAVIPYGRGSVVYGIRLGGAGDVTSTHRAWMRQGVGAFVPTPAAYRGNVYFLGDRGEIQCLDPKNGGVLWRGALPKTSGSYYSSPTIAAGKLYAAREDGAVFVAKIDDKFEFLAENDMGEPIIAAPVPVAGRLLLRGVSHLFCVGAP